MTFLARVLVLLWAFRATLVFAATDYQPGPDSLPQPGVPSGDLLKFTFDQSTIYPGTTRTVTVYVPRQYDPAKPACVHVNFDGVQFAAPVVFDNLIAKGEIPVVIGVFISPGVVPAAHAEALPRYNRSYEYDRTGPDLAKCVLEEILPAVEKLSTPDGRAVHLSTRASDRAIAGNSSGGMAALNAAWERPDAFSRVFTNVGTFVGLQGGDRFSTLVRKTEPKPLRVFLCDGENDNNLYAGDWWMANQMMERALVFAGYEVNHAWGDGGHNQKQATAIFPDAVRWLWRDWPQPVRRGAGSPQLQDILQPGEDWQLVAEGFKFTEGPAADAAGEVHFVDIRGRCMYRIAADGKVARVSPDEPQIIGQCYGPDGRFYGTDRINQQVVYFDREGRGVPVAGGIDGNDLVIGSKGIMYVTELPGAARTSNVLRVLPNGEKQVVDATVKFANGIAFSPDQTMLYVADTHAHTIYSFRIKPDGTLTDREPFFHLHMPETADDSDADGLKVDRDGRVYVATRLGIQVCDQMGRVVAIIPSPGGRVANFCFGGADFSTLYATCGGKVYKRRLKTTGALAWQPPVKPVPPKL